MCVCLFVRLSSEVLKQCQSFGVVAIDCCELHSVGAGNLIGSSAKQQEPLVVELFFQSSDVTFFYLVYF